MSPLLAGLVALFLAGPAPGPADGSIDVAFARRVFQELLWASQDEGGRLWGVPLAGPTLLFDPETGDVVANQPDAEGRLSPVDAGDAPGPAAFAGRVAPDFAGANTALEWAGVHWTVLLWPLPETQHDRLRLLLHESFHRVQDGLGLPAAGGSLNRHLATKDGRTWLLLEFRALARALPAWGPPRRAALEDALAFRAFRRGLFADAAREEDRMEVHEGLAEYTGLAAAGLRNGEARAFLAGRLMLSALKPNLTWSFAYETGPAYGLLLDMDRGEPGDGWRRGLSPESSLSALLAAANGIEPGRPPLEDVLRRAQAYDGATLVAAEERREAERLAAQARDRALLVDGPVLVLPLADVRFSFDPGGVAPLPDAGTLYRTCRFVDAWGVLEVDGAALAAADFASVRVPAPASPGDTHGPGWTLQLAPGWTLVAGARAGDLTVARD